jgi:hypothetical protein
MLEVIGALLALLATEDDEYERLRIVIGIITIFMQSQHLKRIINQRNKALALKSAALLSLRNDPSGAHTWEKSAIYSMIYNKPHHFEFKRMFRMSRSAFEALVTDLSPWIKSGKSRNRRQNLSARMKTAEVSTVSTGFVH